MAGSSNSIASRKYKRGTVQRVRRKNSPPPEPRATTEAHQEAFLKAYAETAVISSAAKLVGIARTRHYEWIDDVEKYPDYRARFDDAHEQACDRLEQELYRRGVEGWEEPVFGSLGGRGSGTGEVGAVRKYSDRLLELLVKARRPERFRERTAIEHTGKGGGPIEMRGGVVTLADLELTEEQMRKALEVARKREGGG